MPMQNTEILSTLPPERGQTPSSAQAQPWSKGSKAPAGRALVFDACHLGVVLRAVLFVETVVGVGAMFGADTLYQWLATVALLTGGALPATLVWLGTACSLKTVLQRLSTAQQYAAGVVLGALAGAYACAMLKLANVAPPSPPWLASAACGALLSAMLVTALVLRARGRTPAATTARLTELQSRIRPHFLFNTLNSAIALVRDEPAKAEQVLADLSDLFRAALAPPQALVTLAEELALAERYLAIEQIRFGDRLQLHWDLNPAAHHALLPPLLLQPLVENAVKYGIEASECGGNVTVTTKLSGHRCILQVTNTLCFTPAKRREVAAGQGIALANVQTRLVLLHDIQAEFSAHEVNGQFVVTLSVPDAPAILI